jgi:SAM-dependent methyltransferase
MPTAAQLAEMFAWRAYHAGNELEYQEGRYQHLLDLLHRYWPTARTVVDFGCGHGHFIRDARAAGWSARGIEFDPVTRQRTAAFSGCEVTDLSNADVVDVATALNSLYAVPDPAEVVKRLKAPRFLVDMAVEENPRLALIARLPARIRRAPASGTPTVLWRATAAGVDRWFAALGYRRIHREVTDVGWPYAQSSNGARRAIGRLSVATSRLVPSFGDRLTALYEKVAG